jgi:hypothetical protein
MLAVLLFSATLAVGSPGLGAAEKPEDAAKPDRVADANELVCRTEQVTGTRFPKKVCRRKAEMDQKRADDQQRVRDTQRQGFNCATNLGPGAC